METSIAWIYPPPRMQSSQHCEQHDIVLTRFGNPELYKPLFCDWHLLGGGVRSNILLLNNPFIHLNNVFGYIWIMNPSRASWGLDPKYRKIYLICVSFRMRCLNLHKTKHRTFKWTGFQVISSPFRFFKWLQQYWKGRSFPVYYMTTSCGCNCQHKKAAEHKCREILSTWST